MNVWQNREYSGNVNGLVNHIFHKPSIEPRVAALFLRPTLALVYTTISIALYKPTANATA
jgi:hypothetical protein